LKNKVKEVFEIAFQFVLEQVKLQICWLELVFILGVMLANLYLLYVIIKERDFL